MIESRVPPLRESKLGDHIQFSKSRYAIFFTTHVFIPIQKRSGDRIIEGKVKRSNIIPLNYLGTFIAHELRHAIISFSN